MSELKTSGPHPKIPSPQAQPATDQADTSVEGKEGMTPVSEPGASPRPATVPWPVASSRHTASISLFVSFVPLSRAGTNTRHLSFPLSIEGSAGTGGGNTLLLPS